MSKLLNGVIFLVILFGFVVPAMSTVGKALTELDTEITQEVLRLHIHEPVDN